MSELPGPEEFCKKFSLEKAALSGFKWEVLQEIAACHMASTKELQTTAASIADRVRQIECVHSIKYRVKHPEHLIEKIVRKKLAGLTPGNYSSKVTDLIGIRALHLFKNEWEPIHEYSTKTWELAEKPIAYVREGDPKALQEQFASAGCDVKFHEYGYRSIHYLLKTQPTKTPLVAEFQVRTLLEEAWSEIDHRVRYPYDSANPIFVQLLGILNRLAGSADEMGTFVRFLQGTLANHDEEKKRLTQELESKISKLQVEEKTKQDLQRRLDELSPSIKFKPSWAPSELNLKTFASSVAALIEAANTPISFLRCKKCGKDFTPEFGYFGPVRQEFCAACLSKK